MDGFPGAEGGGDGDGSDQSSPSGNSPSEERRSSLERLRQVGKSVSEGITAIRERLQSSYTVLSESASNQPVAVGVSPSDNNERDSETNADASSDLVQEGSNIGGNDHSNRGCVDHVVLYPCHSNRAQNKPKGNPFEPPAPGKTLAAASTDAGANPNANARAEGDENAHQEQTLETGRTAAGTGGSSSGQSGNDAGSNRGTGSGSERRVRFRDASSLAAELHASSLREANLRLALRRAREEAVNHARKAARTEGVLATLRGEHDALRRSFEASSIARADASTVQSAKQAVSDAQSRNRALEAVCAGLRIRLAKMERAAKKGRVLKEAVIEKEKVEMNLAGVKVRLEREKQKTRELKTVVTAQTVRIESLAREVSNREEEIERLQKEIERLRPGGRGGSEDNVEVRIRSEERRRDTRGNTEAQSARRRKRTESLTSARTDISIAGGSDSRSDSGSDSGSESGAGRNHGSRDNGDASNGYEASMSWASVKDTRRERNREHAPINSNAAGNVSATARGGDFPEASPFLREVARTHAQLVRAFDTVNADRREGNMVVEVQQNPDPKGSGQFSENSTATSPAEDLLRRVRLLEQSIAAQMERSNQ